jgi:hypothetical protein
LTMAKSWTGHSREVLSEKGPETKPMTDERRKRVACR